MSRKRSQSERSAPSRKREAQNHRLESLLKNFLTSITEASYEVALKCGFRGTFIAFLSDLQEALEKVIQKDGSQFLNNIHGRAPPRAEDLSH